MKDYTIINLLEEHNEASILITAKYNPKSVLFIYKKNKDEYDHIIKLKEYYHKRFYNIEFMSEALDSLHPSKIEDIISRFKDEKVIINLTGGDKLHSLILLFYAKKYNLKSIYIQIDKENLIELDEDIKVHNENFVDLDIEDIIENVGGSVILDSCNITNSKAVEEITTLIANNQTIWQEIKPMIYDNNIFIHQNTNPEIVKINTCLLGSRETKIFIDILNILRGYNELDFTRENNFIKIKFISPYIKSFIFKSGTWLEVYTKKIVESIDVIDDVKNGVLFLWDDKKRRVKNELDVVAVKDSVLICISCKDSAKYDEVALNELNVYADQIGGDKVLKILVSTRMPLKTSIVERAKQMNIELVVFDGNTREFKNKLKNIINK